MNSNIFVKIIVLIFSLSSLPGILICQKGVIEKNSKRLLSQSFSPLIGQNKNIYAVITGISDYQSTKIPDLQFADQDAFEFANWLQSPEGGNVPTENIKLITNRNATLIAFGNALQQLQDSIKEGDLALIYFSGHGDMETKTYYQFGFLLCYDSPPNNYKCGAYAVPFLQDIVSTISNKKAKVILITDACHAGKLAGDAIGGTKETARMLAQRFANEIKIMSCQPDETSAEGVHWGGGRGVFSYYLEKGLNGMA
ncbi:MAG: caspase family protein, partial [Saprospiraceae bacterium]